MCGFFGIATSVPFEGKFSLYRARNALSHRGPDDFGEWWSNDGRIGLSHQRLAINDLSLLAHQPMNLLEYGLTIVFNGEIYNHLSLRSELISLGFSFKSNSESWASNKSR